MSGMQFWRRQTLIREIDSFNFGFKLNFTQTQVVDRVQDIVMF